MKKKISILIIIVVIICCISGLVIYKRNERRKEAAGLELEMLYKLQNRAFEVYNDFEDMKRYHGADELELQKVAVNLYTFDHDQTEYTVTVDEVVDYYSNEYDSQGALKVYSCPENISHYIYWYNNGGDQKISDFATDFDEFLLDHGYGHVYRNLSYDQVTKALEDYEAEK